MSKPQGANAERRKSRRLPTPVTCKGKLLLKRDSA